jgi:hypothetical protein
MLRHFAIHVRPRIAQATALAVLGFMLGACGREAAPPDSLAGSYRLTTINGMEPPVRIYAGSVQSIEGETIPLEVSVTQGSLQMSDGGDYAVDWLLETAARGATATQSVNDRGTYTRAGSRITFASDRDPFGMYHGAFASRVVTLALDVAGGEDNVYAYAR